VTEKIGNNVDAWCTKCKLVLAHTIEGMKAEKVTRVHCNTCNGQHAYRAKAPRPRAASTRTGTKRTAKDPGPSEYETLLRGRTATAARSYATSEQFKVGELLDHTTFGLGVVTGERDHVKIEVAFPDKPRVLLHRS
jgi:hypothetical protein